MEHVAIGTDAHFQLIHATQSMHVSSLPGIKNFEVKSQPRNFYHENFYLKGNLLNLKN